jgi:anti-anti-sigma factor
MDIVVSHQEGRVPVTVFHVTGQITEESYEQLQKQGEAAFQAGMRNLLLDLTDVSFISSSGLRVIHRLYMLLRTEALEDSDEVVRRGLKDGSYQSAHFKLLKPSAAVLRTLEYAGFDMFLQVHTDLEKAIASF